MKSAMEVMQEFVDAQRQCKAASDILDRCLEREIETEAAALEVFEANGWPSVVSLDPDRFIHLEGDEDGHYLIVRDSSGVMLASDMNPLAKESRRFAIKSTAGWSCYLLVRVGCTREGYGYTHDDRRAASWPTYDRAFEAAIEIGIPRFAIVDLYTMAEESAIPEARRAKP
jgi:hypothetical protein